MSTANTTGRCEMQIEKTLRLQTYMDKIDIIKFDLGSHDCFKKARTKQCCKKLVFLTLASNAKLTCFLLTMKHVNIYIYIYRERERTMMRVRIRDEKQQIRRLV